MQLKLSALAIGLVFLGACSSANQATDSASSPAALASAQTQPATTASHGGQGGQVIESGPYHLELVTKKAATGTHIDFFLQKGDTHEVISNAKVTAQVQLPNGTQRSLPMKYDASDQHYTAILPTAAPGEYKVAILTDINGEKVNARYSFKH